MLPSGPFYSQSVDLYLTKRRIGAWRMVGGAGLGFLLIGEPVLRESWVATAMLIPGIACIAVATVGRLWCALYISGRKSSSLVDQGPYSICRHPLYLFNGVGLLGIGLVTESLVITAALCFAYLLLYPPVIRSEDRVLTVMFPTHVDYISSTPAVWPDLRSFRTEATWLVEVYAFNRNLRDSIWFPLGAGVIQFIELLHQLHWLPTLVALW